MSIAKYFFINMGDKFKGLDTNIKIPTAGYYRLDLHNLLPDVDRILYMDGDTARRRLDCLLCRAWTSSVSRL